jgi:hypothetical protein
MAKTKFKEPITVDEGVLHRINEFADAARETTGASFTISKNKMGNWTVSLVNCGKQFLDSSLLIAITNAKEWLLEHRKEVEVETKYTLYDR